VSARRYLVYEAPQGVPARLYLDPMREQGLHALPEARAAQEAAWCRESGADWQLLEAALDVHIGPGLKMCYWLARAAKLPKITSTCVGGLGLWVRGGRAGWLVQ
jgi:N-acetyl-beta-hexosaminidase